MAGKMQGGRIFRNEAYIRIVTVTKDEAQRRRWAFYKACSLEKGKKGSLGSCRGMGFVPFASAAKI
jgi:hypothetical protein